MQTFANHKHWSAVKAALEKLSENGFQALLAGGCVRDLLMGREPNDFDIATNATPDEVQKLFPKSLEIGKAFGVMILPQGDFQIEIATFRQDGDYQDGRRPESVIFATAKEDAQRRDFTVNALFYDVKTQAVLDYVGGQKDIQAQLIRTVGVPLQRFTEDKLRLLRAVRFAAQLGFQIEVQTMTAITQQAAQINLVSHERIRDEVLKLLRTPLRFMGLKLLHSSGLQAAVFPHFSKDQWQKTEALFQLAPQALPEEVLWALLFYAYPKSELKQTLQNLRLANPQRDQVLWILQMQETFMQPQKQRLADVLLVLSEPNAHLAQQFYAIVERLGDATIAERARFLEEASLKYLSEGQSRPQPFLSGHDLQKLGLAAGPKMGELLREVYKLQLEKKISSQEEARKWIQTQMI